MVGREIGRGADADTVYRTGTSLGVLAFFTGAVIGLFMLVGTRLFLSPVIYPIFNLSPKAEEICTLMLTVTTIVLPLRSFNATNIVGVLRGGGDVRIAAIIDTAPQWLAALPLTILFGLVFKWGIFWVYVGISMENIVKFGLGVTRMRSRRWINDLTLADRAG